MHRRFLVLSTVALLLAGCGGGHGTVTGTVTLDGEPVKQGAVTFHPGGGGAIAYGQIVDGKYSLQTGTRPGLAPGTYAVTVAAYGELHTPPGQVEPVPKLLTPARYTDANTSGLSFTVTSGSNTIDLPLTTR